jgi:hypothetical protein
VRSFDVGAARYYLEGLEFLARHGRTSEDPREALAALRILATPSRVLLELAGLRPINPRRPSTAPKYPRIGEEPFNLSPAELEEIQ